jgi:hypothetical protein
VPLANRKCVSPEDELRQAITAGKLVDLCDRVHGDRRVYRADARRHLRALVGDRMHHPLDELRPGRGQTTPPS